MRRPRPALAVHTLLLALAGCGVENPPSGSGTATRQAVPDAADPLIASIVNDPLMTDLQLTARSNADAIRPPDMPPTLMIPSADTPPVAADTGEGRACAACAGIRDAPTLAAFAVRQDSPAMRACAPAMGYAAGWAARLAADLPLPPAAHVVEAGGVDRDDCTLRAVAFTAAVSPAEIARSYTDVARRAGYAVDVASGRGETLLRGRRARDGAAFTLYLRDAGAIGTDARLVADTGG